MIDALSASAAGLAASANRFDKAAQNVVRASVPQTDKPGPEPAGGDLPAAIADTKTSEISYRANAAAFKAADKMLGKLLDTVV